jgi:hypothetical protein
LVLVIGQPFFVKNQKLSFCKTGNLAATRSIALKAAGIAYPLPVPNGIPEPAVFSRRLRAVTVMAGALKV